MKEIDAVACIAPRRRYALYERFRVNSEAPFTERVPVYPFSATIPERTDRTLVRASTILHPFNGLFSRTTWMSRCQKGKTSLDLNEARNDRESEGKEKGKGVGSGGGRDSLARPLA